MPQLLSLAQQPTRDDILADIRRRLVAREQTLASAIGERELYFRISVVGACNLSCAFCHNEGAPTHGKINANVVDAAIRAAVAAGFTRVQFTGGEPLLHPGLDEFIRIARTYVDDVGVTTNGTYLPQRLDGLVAAGLHRLHVSLQTETLIDKERDGQWCTPAWLMPTVSRAAEGAFILRLNLPVPADALDEAEQFLAPLTANRISIKVFSLLPEGAGSGDNYPVEDLEALVERVNAGNSGNPHAGRVDLRGYRPPSGVRCSTCGDRPRCKEQSHSLRLGADLVLRPCLATRQWDVPIRWPSEQATLEASVIEQGLLALDYQW